MRKALSLALVLSLAASPAGAVGFQDVLPGARAMGMGHAFSAIADDAWGLYYNPAGTANTPYLQASGTMGRVFSPVGTLSFASGSYLRPYDPINTATVGATYRLLRQNEGGRLDSLMFNYAQEYMVRDIGLTRPLKIGANAKVVSGSSSPSVKSKLGLGFDAGVLARGSSGFAASFVLSDMVTEVGYPRPALTMGVAYAWMRRLTFAGDFKIRGGLAEFMPGLEASFHQGLLKARVGKGIRLNGAQSLALGVGVDFSPAIIDLAMNLPTGGWNRDAGSAQATFTWRFGAPSFAGRFVGQAAAEAQELKARLDELEERKKTLDQQTTASETNRAVSSGELQALERRVREAQDQYRALLKRNEELEYRAAERAAALRGLPAPPPPKAKKPAGPAWPKRHEVRPGETLRSLAQRYYGEANQWERIYDANRGKVDRGLPVEGEILTIPAPR